MVKIKVIVRIKLQITWSRSRWVYVCDNMVKITAGGCVCDNLIYFFGSMKRVMKLCT